MLHVLNYLPNFSGLTTIEQPPIQFPPFTPNFFERNNPSLRMMVRELGPSHVQIALKTDLVVIHVVALQTHSLNIKVTAD